MEDSMMRFNGRSCLGKVKVHLRVKQESSLWVHTFQEDEVIIRFIRISQLNNNIHQEVQTEKQFKFTSITPSHSSQFDVYEEYVRETVSNPFNSSGASFCG
jgi:hypothetical protein